MADSGASINILDEKEYHALPNCPKRELRSVKIYGYHSKVPLRVLEKFSTALESEMKTLHAKFYVVRVPCSAGRLRKSLIYFRQFSKSKSYRRNRKKKHPRMY